MSDFLGDREAAADQRAEARRGAQKGEKPTPGPTPPPVDDFALRRESFIVANQNTSVDLPVEKAIERAKAVHEWLTKRDGDQFAVDHQD